MVDREQQTKSVGEAHRERRTRTSAWQKHL